MRLVMISSIQRAYKEHTKHLPSGQTWILNCSYVLVCCHSLTTVRVVYWARPYLLMQEIVGGANRTTTFCYSSDNLPHSKRQSSWWTNVLGRTSVVFVSFVRTSAAFPSWWRSYWVLTVFPHSPAVSAGSGGWCWSFPEQGERREGRGSD